jgi:hypothetical protein
MDVKILFHEANHSVRNILLMALELEALYQDANPSMNLNSTTMINRHNIATIAMRMHWMSEMENEAISAAPRTVAPFPNQVARLPTPNFQN